MATIRIVNCREAARIESYMRLTSRADPVCISRMKISAGLILEGLAASQNKGTELGIPGFARPLNVQ